VPAAAHVAGNSFAVNPRPLARRTLGAPSGHGFVSGLSAFSVSAARRSGPRLAPAWGNVHDRRAPAQLAVNGHGNGPMPAVVLPDPGGFAALAVQAAGWPRPAFMARPCRFLCEQVAAWPSVERRPAGGDRRVGVLAAGRTEVDGHGLYTPLPKQRPGCAGTAEVLEIARDLSTVSTKFTACRGRVLVGGQWSAEAFQSQPMQK
jgi:hypothetical protein